MGRAGKEWRALLTVPLKCKNEEKAIISPVGGLVTLYRRYRVVHASLEPLGFKLLNRP